MRCARLTSDVCDAELTRLLCFRILADVRVPERSADSSAHRSRTRSARGYHARKPTKVQGTLLAFGWDTEPIMGGEEVIEEAFVDVFCDLIYGGGWMDDERREETDRECNWALVSGTARPSSCSRL